MQRPVSLPRLLDHMSGRHDATVARLLDDDALDPALVAGARALLDAGRRAMTAPAPSGRALRRARRIFREHHAVRDPRPGVFRLVLDTLLGPATAVRSAAEAPPRFLRFEGDATLELQIERTAGGRVTLRGQLMPPATAPYVVIVFGKQKKRVRIDDDGTFVARGLPAKPWRLEFEGAGSVDVEP